MDDLGQLADEHLAKAESSPHGRSAHVILHNGYLRQTVIALTAGTALEEHSAPRAASLQVLRGRVSLTKADGPQEIPAGHLHPIPPQRHGLIANEDSVVILTTVTV
ncbi:MAG: cupin [Mycobacteriaceae bacterium]|nr:cupin [Mycobacteriaceae bacterium]